MKALKQLLSMEVLQFHTRCSCYKDNINKGNIYKDKIYKDKKIIIRANRDLYKFNRLTTRQFWEKTFIYKEHLQGKIYKDELSKRNLQGQIRGFKAGFFHRKLDCEDVIYSDPRITSSVICSCCS